MDHVIIAAAIRLWHHW